jgi:uncharacterized protein involved in outer membrane biogenesis
MRWKKIVIVAALIFVVLIVALYVFVEFYDFNKFKPLIAGAVKNATGRELKIKGDVDIEIGFRPTIVVEDVSFQNATWSTRPELGRVKRLEVQMAVWPLISGKFDFARLVLIEPDVIVEFDSAGTSNFSFDTAGEDPAESEIPPPPLIFSDIIVERGLFTYQDARSNFKFSVNIAHLTAKIPGFDESLQLDFEGQFDDIPLTLNGTVGPIWAWVEPGYSLPVNLTAKNGGTTASISGELRDPINFKDLAFDITAQGPSVAEVTTQAGISGVPELGAFKMTTRLSDATGKLAVEKLDIQIGSQKLAAISLTGNIKDVSALQGISLNFSALGQDSARLTQFGLPALPERGAFQVAAQISDPEAKVFSINDLSVVLGENEMSGQVDINLAEEVPFLTAKLTSQKFRLGQFNLDLEMTNLVEKPAIKKLDLKLGTPDLAEISLKGIVDDLIQLQGVKINFYASGKDLANLKQVTGRPLPIRGAFSAAGEVLIPDRKNLKIPELKITVGKNDITGLLNLDLRGDQPQLDTKLSLPKLDLPSVLRPQLAKEGWAKGLGLVRPIKLDLKLAGFFRELALKKVDFRAGTLNSAELRLSGSVANLMDQQGVDLNFSLRGHEIAKLEDITAQPFIFIPLPGQGAYFLSGHISDPIANVYKIKKLKFSIAGTKLGGRLDINIAGQSPVYELKMSGPKFNLKPFPIPKEAAYANLKKIDDLGPFQVHSKVVVDGGRLTMPNLDMRAGSDQLVSIVTKGSIKNLSEQKGIDLNFNIQGNEIANLKKLTGQPIPLKGAFGLNGRLTDPDPNKYKLSDLKLKLGKNNINGSLDLNLSGKQPQLAADFAAQKFSLQPVTLTSLETLSRIEDLGPLKLAFKLAGHGKKFTLNNLNFNLGRDDLIQVLLKGSINDLSAVSGMKLEFSAKGKQMSNFKKLGGPEIPFEGAFNVSGRFVDPAPKIYKLPDFNALWGDNNQSGWLELDLSAKRPRLKGELSSDKLDLRPFIPQDKKQNAVKSQSTEQVPKEDKKSKVKVFPAEPLPLEGLQVLDADLKFREKQILLPTLALDDVILHVLLKGGNLEIKPFKFTIGGGKADVRFAVRSQDKPVTLAANLNINQLEIGPMLDKLGYERSVEGNMDADINLDGSGDSVAALMAGLNGNTRIVMSNGHTASKHLELLEKWLGTGILRMLNPFEERRQYTPINCFVNKIEIRDGLADLQLLLDTDRTSIFGAGDVNLKTEGLNLGIKPTPRKSALPTGISFSLTELSQPFRLGGTLANPSLAIDPGRTALVIGKMAGALALGPIGVAAFFADVSVGKKDPCALAMEAVTQKNQQSDTKEAADLPKEPPAKKEKKENKKSGGFFKRLFGK